MDTIEKKELGEIQKEAIKELKNLETEINSMLMDFKKKYYKKVMYDIELFSEHENVKKNNIKLSPSIILRMGVYAD